MALLVIQHPVRDYQAWRSVYDSMGDVQRTLGVTAESVHQQAGDPNNVLVLHHFATTTQAEAFLTSPELQDAMQRAGVQGHPRIEVYE
jgi:hypothetical protein